MPYNRTFPTFALLLLRARAALRGKILAQQDMKSGLGFHRISTAIALSTLLVAQSQKPFPVVSTLEAPEIAGRPVHLDAQGKLLPWPIADDTGYSYSSDVLTQWQILWDQYNRQRLPYYMAKRAKARGSGSPNIPSPTMSGSVTSKISHREWKT
jgi:hypothetical protein